MKLQKINGHQSFGMAHKIDYTGVTPIEREALKECDLTKAFEGVKGTVDVSKVLTKPGGNLAFPANWLYRIVLERMGYKERFLFNLPAGSLTNSGSIYTGFGTNPVSSGNVKGLTKDDLVRVFGRAISEVQRYCTQEIPEKVVSSMAKAS